MTFADYSRLRAPGRFTNDEFIEFIARRPREEAWQMLDGEAATASPPSLLRMLLTSNFALQLNSHAEMAEQGLFALQSSGIVLPEAGMWCPRVDLALVDGGANPDPAWAARFKLIAEVMCLENPVAEIERRVHHYMEHPDNLYLVVIAQDTACVEIWPRRTNWEPIELTRLDDTLELPEFGFTTTLRAIYNGSPVAASQ